MIDFSRAGASATNAVQQRSRRDFGVASPLLGLGQITPKPTSEQDISFAKQLSESQNRSNSRGSIETPVRNSPPEIKSRDRASNEGEPRTERVQSYTMSAPLKRRLGFDEAPPPARYDSEGFSKRIRQDENTSPAPEEEQQRAPGDTRPAQLGDALFASMPVANPVLASDAAQVGDQNPNMFLAPQAEQHVEPKVPASSNPFNMDRMNGLVQQGRAVPNPSISLDQTVTNPNNLITSLEGNGEPVAPQDGRSPMSANSFVEHFQDGFTGAPRSFLFTQSPASSWTPQGSFPVPSQVLPIEQNPSPQTLNTQSLSTITKAEAHAPLLAQINQLANGFEQANIEWIGDSSSNFITEGKTANPAAATVLSTEAGMQGTQPLRISETATLGLDSGERVDHPKIGLTADFDSPLPLGTHPSLDTVIGAEQSQNWNSLGQLRAKLGAREFAAADKLTSFPRPDEMQADFTRAGGLGNEPLTGPRSWLGTSPNLAQGNGPMTQMAESNLTGQFVTQGPTARRAQNLIGESSFGPKRLDTLAAPTPTFDNLTFSQSATPETLPADSVNVFETASANPAGNSVADAKAGNLNTTASAGPATSTTLTAGAPALGQGGNDSSFSDQSQGGERGAQGQGDIAGPGTTRQEKNQQTKDPTFAQVFSAQESSRTAQRSGSLDADRLSEKAARTFTRAVQQRVIDTANRMVIQGATGQARIKLQDSSLGAVDILVSVSGDRKVAIDLQTDSSDLKNRIEMKLDDIRDGLQSQKFNSVDIKVVADSQTGTSMDSPQKNSQQRDGSNNQQGQDPSRNFQQSNNSSSDSGQRDRSHDSSRSQGILNTRNEQNSESPRASRYEGGRSASVNLKGNINVRA